jgi:hypothetical protein
MKLERSAEWQELSVNHLEGRTAAFFCYGDGGGDELEKDGRPRLLRHKHYFDPDAEPFENDREAYAPLVGNADTVVLRCRIPSGATLSLAVAKSMATTRPRT